MKRIAIFLVIILSAFFLSSCSEKERTININLPEGIYLADENLNVKKLTIDSEVEFLVDPPVGKELEKLMINGVDKTLMVIDGKFKIKITEGLTISAIYKNKVIINPNKYTVTLGERLSADKNLTDLPHGTALFIRISVPTNQEINKFTVDGEVIDLEGNEYYRLIVTSNHDVKVTFKDLGSEEPDKYTVTWKNDDGTVLEVDVDVAKGTMPSYDGAEPTKEATANHTYEFSGWSPQLAPVAKNIEYTATFTSIEISHDNFIFVDKGDGGYSLQKYLGNQENVVIPAKYEGKPVVSIEQWAFFKIEAMKSVVIPESVLYIREDAFSTCEALETVTVGKNVKSIELHAFFGCTSLKSINLPEGLTSLGPQIFFECTSLKSISLPDSIESVGSALFEETEFNGYTEYENGKYLGNEGNPHLVFIEMIDGTATTISIHNNCKLIANTAFENKVIETINFGSRVQIIGASAFRRCSSLSEIAIPNSVSKIGNAAFRNSSITKVNMGSNVKYIGSNAFENCTSLTTISLPNDIEFIGSYAFDYCNALIRTDYENCSYLGNSDNPYLFLEKANNTSINSVTIHKDTKIIGSVAFNGCTNLTTITIPKNVINIGNNVFYNCKNLTEIIVDANNVTYAAPNQTCIIEKASQTLVVGLGNTIIPEGVTSIGEYAFYSCDQLKSLTIPNGVTSIAESAFMYCMYLESITIPNSVISIGEYAFSDCYNLKAITIPNSLVSIKQSTFNRCYKVTSLIIPDSVVYIGYSAFYGCEMIENLTIGNNVVVISELAFTNCSALTEIVIPNNVKVISGQSFSGCEKVTSISIGSGVKIIGILPFDSCDEATIIIDNENEVYDSRDNCSAIIETKTNTLASNTFHDQ